MYLAMQKTILKYVQRSACVYMFIYIHIQHIHAQKCARHGPRPLLGCIIWPTQEDLLEKMLSKSLNVQDVIESIGAAVFKVIEAEWMRMAIRVGDMLVTLGSIPDVLKVVVGRVQMTHLIK